MGQRKRILDELKKGRFISPLEALQEFGCFRLGGRIHELRRAGYDIRTVINGGDKKYAKYYLVEQGLRRVF